MEGWAGSIGGGEGRVLKKTAKLGVKVGNGNIRVGRWEGRMEAKGHKIAGLKGGITNSEGVVNSGGSGNTQRKERGKRRNMIR